MGAIFLGRPYLLIIQFRFHMTLMQGKKGGMGHFISLAVGAVGAIGGTCAIAASHFGVRFIAEDGVVAD